MTGTNITVETGNIKQLKKRKLQTKRKERSSRALEKFLHEMLQRDIEAVNQESAMLSKLVSQLEAILLNIKLKLKYNDLQLSLQEYREKVSQSNLNVNLDSILQNQYNPQPYQNQYNSQLYQNQPNSQLQQNAKQDNPDNVVSFSVKSKLPDLSAFNSDGTAVLPDGELFTSTPLIT
jgi:hypothetical protein